jgi:hypothetical protein
MESIILMCVCARTLYFEILICDYLYFALVIHIDNQARGDHWAKIVEQRAIKNRVQFIHCG